MIKIKFTIFLLCSLFHVVNVNAQKNPIEKSIDSKIKKIINTRSQSKWIEFKKDSRIEAKSMFEVHKNAFGLDRMDKMELYKVQSDQLGYNHFRYQQKYKGIKVEGAEFIVHSKNGFVLKSNGKIVTGLNLKVV